MRECWQSNGASTQSRLCNTPDATVDTFASTHAYYEQYERAAHSVPSQSLQWQPWSSKQSSSVPAGAAARTSSRGEACGAALASRACSAATSLPSPTCTGGSLPPRLRMSGDASATELQTCLFQWCRRQWPGAMGCGIAQNAFHTEDWAAYSHINYGFACSFVGGVYIECGAVDRKSQEQL